MSKKIVVITGSPRKNGNSFAMTDAFILLVPVVTKIFFYTDRTDKRRTHNTFMLKRQFE